MIGRAGLPVALSLSRAGSLSLQPYVFPPFLLTVAPYALGMAIFAVSDSVKAAAITAIIAGVFSVLNTVLNGTIFKKVSRLEKKQNRLMEIAGERHSDKASTASGRNPEPVEIDKDRRKC